MASPPRSSRASTGPQPTTSAPARWYARPACHFPTLNEVIMLLPCRTLALALGALTALAAPAQAHTPSMESANRLLAGHTGEIFALAYSPDGRVIASSGSDLTIRLWEPSTG